MLHVIRNEVSDKRHADYGAFWLFLCSHGTDSNHIYGSDDVLVNMRDVYDLLTSCNFPEMAGKPKMVVIQACSGGKLVVLYKQKEPIWINSKSVIRKT